jgi:hypothetical protein
MNLRKFSLVAPAALALLGTFAITAAQAHGANAQWSVTIGAPVLTLPVPVLRLPLPAPVIVLPAPRPQTVVVAPAYPRGGHYPDYREPTRWDVDGDGIPNRYDRVYNPVWDRNGDGIPDHRAHRAHPYGDRDHDGVPNRYDRRDDRFDDRRDRRDWPGDRRGDWRGPR